MFLYLFLDRGEGKEKERERNIIVWLLLECPHQGPGPQPRHVPWLGIKPATLWFTARTQSTELNKPGLITIFSNDGLFHWYQKWFNFRSNIVSSLTTKSNSWEMGKVQTATVTLWPHTFLQALCIHTVEILREYF